MSWQEYYCYGTTFSSLTAGSGATFVDNVIRIDTDSDFAFVKTMFYPLTSRVRVRYRDDTNGRFLQKDSQDIRTIGGTSFLSMAPGVPIAPGFLPFIWPKPYIISAATTLTVGAADFSGLSSDFRLAFHGSKIRPGRSPWDRKFRAMMPYVYPISSTGTIDISANDNRSVSIPTDNDSHFLLYKITGARDGSCTIDVKDAARDRQWMNTPIHFDNFVGNGHFPNILPSPRFIPRGSVIALNLTDLSGATNTVELNFIGVKLYE